MGLLDLIFGRSAPAFSRPFHKNQTKADFREWFSKAPSWSTLDPRITDALTDRLYGNPMFEVFVHLSWETDLVKQYAPLAKLLEIGIAEALLGQINTILFRTGTASLERLIDLMKSPRQNQDALKKYYGFAQDSFECSIEIQPAFLHSYVQLAVLKHLFNHDDEARELCRKGLAQSEDLKKVPLPTRPELNLRGAVDEAETKLRALLKDLG